MRNCIFSFIPASETAGRVQCSEKARSDRGRNDEKAYFGRAASILISACAYAEVIKIGVVGPFSGPFAIQGKNFKAGIDAYIATHGDKVGEDTIEILYRDVPQADPAQSKALAQELVVKEGVQYLAGFYFTPDAMAVTPLLKQANVPMVIMNAATSAIVTKSPLGRAHVLHHMADLCADGEDRAGTRCREGNHSRQRLWPGCRCGERFQDDFREGGRQGRRIHPHAAFDQ